MTFLVAKAVTLMEYDRIFPFISAVGGGSQDNKRCLGERGITESCTGAADGAV